MEKLLAELEEIMDLDEDTLKKEDVLEEYEEWDSLTKLSLIALAKKEYGRIIGVDQIRALKTVEDIVNLLLK